MRIKLHTNALPTKQKNVYRFHELRTREKQHVPTISNLLINSLRRTNARIMEQMDYFYLVTIISHLFTPITLEKSILM